MKIEFEIYPNGSKIEIIIDTHSLILKIDGKICDRKRYTIKNFNEKSRIQFWGKNFGIGISTCHAQLDIAYDNLKKPG